MEMTYPLPGGSLCQGEYALTETGEGSVDSGTFSLALSFTASAVASFTVEKNITAQYNPPFVFFLC